ncbi:peptidoglycan-binding domain-containing protein [Paraliomyxa miuraensis]|uniref:peptidoglycan-binding domain-containing protein n=1 Tax=Paraliomyxa miuraensis TaxID=376150 RepID=UPI002255FDFC|nr:peptidoglycan-binding domain-containing protein [Paraliomyxa miuraensis]MCX4242911.1 peptidoglycan-binding protein [Paraliomyxa miuraensis]
MSSERWLNLELRDSTGAPMSSRGYALALPDGTRREGTLDADGRLHASVPAGTERLLLYVAERCLELHVEGLPAADTVEGVQERLNHLNYFVGKVDGELGRFTRTAVERFQRDHGLSVTGEVDDATAKRLQREHGA